MLLAHDEEEVCGAIFTDLSEALACFSHDLIIAKLNTYGSIKIN